MTRYFQVQSGAEDQSVSTDHVSFEADKRHTIKMQQSFWAFCWVFFLCVLISVRHVWVFIIMSPFCVTGLRALDLLFTLRGNMWHQSTKRERKRERRGVRDERQRHIWSTAPLHLLGTSPAAHTTPFAFN